MRRWMTRRTDGGPSSVWRDPVDVVRATPTRRSAGPSSRRRARSAMTTSSSADGDRADGVPAGFAGDVGEEHADEGEHQADERADVLEQHDRQLGLLRAADEAPPRSSSCGLSWSASLYGRAQRERLEQRWRTAGCRWRRAGSRPRAGGAASRCPRRGRTARPSRTARAARRRPRSSARARSRTGARRRRPCARPLAAEQQQAPGCRCRRGSGRPRRAGRPSR